MLGGSADAADTKAARTFSSSTIFFDGAVDPVLNNVCVERHRLQPVVVACTTDADCITNWLASAAVARCHTRHVAAMPTARTPATSPATPVRSPTRIARPMTSACRRTTRSAGYRPDADPVHAGLRGGSLDLSRTVAQFLVFNEFEQRLSRQATVDCIPARFSSRTWRRRQRTRSIFSAGVAGTLSGQSRIGGVVNEDNVRGRRQHVDRHRPKSSAARGRSYQFPTCDLVDSRNTVSGAGKNLHVSRGVGPRAISYICRSHRGHAVRHGGAANGP